MLFRMPAEWAHQEELWIGFPGDATEWPIDLDKSQFQTAAFANAVVSAHQKITVLVKTKADFATASALTSPAVRICQLDFGDIWLRDTGPLAVISTDGSRALMDFDFNGWGGKFEMPGDADIGARIASTTCLPCQQIPLIFEGGAVDTDGTGLFVTTEQCLLNPNRNPTLDRRQIETILSGALGLSQMLWLGDGLHNDHTDGHVDNLARFVAPGILAIPRASDPLDPNSYIYEDAANRARAFGLEVAPMPSVGRYEIDGCIAPASYMNFCITNGAVIVPQYGASNDQAALDALKPFFPDRAIVGLPSDAILRGGGSFHCLSQHLPAAA